MEGEHEKVSSYALIPEHILSKLDPTLSSGLKTKTYDSKVARPLDSVIRVDIVGPINLRTLRLISGKQASTENQALDEADTSGVIAGAFPKKKT
jgi:hypothetical protein